ncbi:MAG: hypothetical protein M3441_22810 [Chloroflexota bacterium]|nr:hypothetical protein [Chloroflexota bacterium]
MNLVTIGYLEAREIPKYREMRALHSLAEKGHPGLSIERAVAAVAEFEAFLAEVRERFEVEDDALIYINAHNGRIVERV